MPIINLTYRIHAPIERCFDLSRCIDLHTESTSHTEERAVGGVTRGLIALGEEVTWEARHFGIRQNLTTRITMFDPPYHFRDTMVKGAFKRFDHDHFFEPSGEITIMVDRFDFDAPLGILGRAFSSLVLTDYMRRFLIRRNEMIKEIAESPTGWQRFLLHDPRRLLAEGEEETTRRASTNGHSEVDDWPEVDGR